MTSTIVYVLAGAATPTGGQVVVSLNGPGAVQLLVSTRSDMVGATASATVSVDTDGYAKVATPALSPDTQYWYQVKVDGTATSWIGTLRTPPVPGTAKSFTFGFGGCGAQSQTSPAYSQIAARAPAFFVHLGDFGYLDNGGNVPTAGELADPETYHRCTESLLKLPDHTTLIKQCGYVRVWDDHDWAFNNADRTNIASLGGGISAQGKTFRQTMPHYPLPDIDAIYHAFTWGRVRFCMLDSRHDRDPDDAVNNSSKTFLGAAQKAWLLNEIAAYQADDSLVLLVIGNPSVWTADRSGSLGTPTNPVLAPGAGGGYKTDTWAVYEHERAAISDYIAAGYVNGAAPAFNAKFKGCTKQIIHISSDMHGTALDDGTNSDFAANRRPSDGHGHITVPSIGKTAQPMVVAQAGAFFKNPYVKGGPWSHGATAGNHRYGFCTVAETTKMHVKIELVAVTAPGDNISYEWDVPLSTSGGPPPPPPPPPSGNAVVFIDGVGHTVAMIGNNDLPLTIQG